MKDLVILKATGERENCGAIAAKRMLGATQLYLTYNEDDRMWWIVARSGSVTQKLGYVEARREIAWETYRDLDELELAKLKSS